MSDERSMEELLAEWEALTEPIHEAINPHFCTAGRGTCDVCEGARHALDGLWRVFRRTARAREAIEALAALLDYLEREHDRNVNSHIEYYALRDTALAALAPQEGGGE